MPELPAHEGRDGPVIPQAVILRNGEQGPEVVLVLRTSPRAWELPGGYIDPGETPEVAIIREVREETGLHVRIERLVGRYRRSGFRPHRSPVYACRVEAGTLRRSHEAIKVAWFPTQRLPLGLFPWYRPTILDAATGVSHQAEVVQRLGLVAILTAGAIHLGGILGILR